MRRPYRVLLGLTRLLGAAALLLVCASGHAATPGEKVGDTVTGMLEFAGKQVPLPLGPWEVIALDVQPAARGEAPYGVVRTAILLRREGTQVRALLEVSGNEIAVSSGWSGPCAGGDLPTLSTVRYRSHYDASCAAVGSTRPDSSGPAAWEKARAGLLRDGLHLPDTMLTATILSADLQDFLEVRLHVRELPGRDGAAQRQSLLDWAGLYGALLDEGLSHRLDGLAVDWPGRAQLLQQTPVLDRRLLRIEALQRAGAITVADARAQEAAAVQEVAMSAPDPRPRNSLYNRITSPLINLGTAYSVTRDAPISVAIAATEYLARQFLDNFDAARWPALARELMPEPWRMPVLPHLGTPVEESTPLSLADLKP